MTPTTPNEREDWAKTFLEAGTKEIGMDLSVLVGVVSEIVSRTRQEEREKVVEYLRHGMNTGALEEGIKWMQEGSNKDHKGYTKGFNTARNETLNLLEQARNLT